ncbi:MAG TPA: DNA primase [Longimicrobiales bacterium]|nr:DNA primase [Longimicrobiales bacterium]
MIPESIVDEIRARADIVEVIGEQISLKRAGKDFRALCPFHHEKTPSFYVVPAKGFYKCFGCGEAGDVFSFLMKRTGVTFQEAVRELGGKYGVDVPDLRREEGEEPHRRLYEAIAFAAEHFRERLWEAQPGERARRYLEGRGISREVAERFGLGYALDDWRVLREAAHRHGIDDAVLLEAGLIKESERSEEPYDRFRDRLIFPIAELGGRVVAFGGRVLRPTENAPKYLNSPETPIYHKGQLLYGLNWSKGAIRREGAALVVEGYMDYVSLAARGVEHVVAALGTAMTVEQANLLARYAGKALLLYDSDTAGLKATFRTGDALLRAGVHPLVVTLPAGEDPDSIARRGGAEALRPLLAGAADVVECKIRILEERGLLSDIEGVRRALDRLLPTIRATVDPALRDIYVSRISERTGVRRETLEREATERRAEPRPDAGPRVARRGPAALEPRLSGIAAERLLLRLMIRDPANMVPAALAAVGSSNLHDPRHRAIFDALAAGHAAGELEVMLPAEAVQAARELAADPEPITDATRMLNEALTGIHFQDLRLQQRVLRLRQAEAPPTEKAELYREAAEISRQLRALAPDPKRAYSIFPRFRKHPPAPEN